MSLLFALIEFRTITKDAQSFYPSIFKVISSLNPHAASNFRQRENFPKFRLRFFSVLRFDDQAAFIFRARAKNKRFIIRPKNVHNRKSVAPRDVVGARTLRAKNKYCENLSVHIHLSRMRSLAEKYLVSVDNTSDLIRHHCLSLSGRGEHRLLYDRVCFDLHD